MEERSPRRPPLGLIIALIAIALSAGSAAAWFTWRSIRPIATNQLPTADFPELEIEGERIPEGFEAPTVEPITVPDPPETEIAAEPAQRQETIYWVSTQGTEVALAPAEIALPEGVSTADTLKLALADLIVGPAQDSGDVANSIPQQTELLALRVETNGIHVNLSKDFERGGGSASMIGRLAQVVYTATTLEPNAPVWITVEGDPLRVLGGEGLLVRYPLDRTDLAVDFGVSALSN